MPFSIFTKFKISFIKTPLNLGVFLLILFWGVFLTQSIALSVYEKYAPGDEVTIGEFVYEDDFSPSVDNCFADVYNPQGVLVVNGELMTADANGWHHYTFTPDSQEGIWPTTMYCGTVIAGNLAKIDKSFVVGYISASTTPIADAVWRNSQRTLTAKTLGNGESLSTENYVNLATSSLSVLMTDTQNLITTLHNISAEDVWAYAGRDLDSPVNVAAETSDAVWGRATLSLNSAGSIGKLISDNLDAQISSRGTSMLTAADVWNSAARTLTDYSTSTITEAVWANANRTLTAYGNDITAADVWNVLTDTLNVNNSIGKQLKDNTDAQISTIPDLVWTSSSRLLTDYATSSIATAVWNNPVRSLTTFGTLVADIWSDLTAPDRKLTSAVLTGGGSLVKEDYLSTSLESVSSTIINQVLQNKTLLNNLNNISADDVWSFVGRDLDNPTVVTASTSAAVWEQATNTFTSAGSVGKFFVDNLDVKISTRGTSMLTAADVWDAANRTLTDYSTSSIALGVWSDSARTLTNYGNDITAADVWNVLSNSLINVGSIGKQLADNVDVRGSTIVDEVQQNRTLINGLSTISAADVWSYAGRDLDAPTTLVASTTAAVWNTALNTLSSNGTIGKLFVDNLDEKISTRATSSITAADVWNAAERTLSDYSTSTITEAVWANANRTLTFYGNDIEAADVWNVLTNTLLNVGSIGKLLGDNVDVKASIIVDEIQQNRVLINNLHNISADDVWSHVGRDLDTPNNVADFTSAAVWDKATNSFNDIGSVGKLFVDNLDAKISTRGTSSMTAADVWNVAERTLTDYSTSTISNAIWANANRTLTSYGNDITGADVWNVLTNTLLNVGSIGKLLSDNIDSALSTRASLSVQQAGFTVQMSDASSIAAGKTYRAKLYVLNSESVPTDSNSRPVITIYDADRNIVVNGVNMGKLSNGVYEYTYSVANGAAPGLWETAVSTEVSPGKTVETNDFWVVEASPAQVIINGISDAITPLVAANITITNEGLSGYEYHYEWCVVANAGNACGGNDDVFYASAAKFINPGDDWNTTLTATVPNAGNYFFKLVVYFGTDHSSASRLFAAVADPVIPVIPPAPAPASSGGGGGGGGSNNPEAVIPIDWNKPQSGSNTFQSNEGGNLRASTPNDLFLNVSVPAKALSSASTITATPVSPQSQPAPLAGVQLVGDMMFDLKSSNGQQTFGKPIVLTFNYTDEQIRNFSEESLKVYWYDENAKKWVVLPTTLYQGKNMIMAETTHFSLFSIFGKEKVKNGSCQGADFNHDKRVNSIDFSILLAFWKTSSPFRNPCVDVNSDKNVNSVDFSILMFEWGSKK